jgi:prepilin-type N-terminal cleavage/methylation domain-containing protein
MKTPSFAPAASWRSRAFTLIELLVVIAIIAILAGMLIPALAKAKEKSQRSYCMNNNKQLALSMQMYCTDNVEVMPYPNWGNTEGPGWLYQPEGGNPPDLWNATYRINPALAYTGGLFWSFIKNPNIYRCPIDKTNAAANKYFAGRANKLSTYIMNGAVCGYDGPAAKHNVKPNSYKITQFKSTAYVMWEPDENKLNNGAPIGSFAYNDASSYPNVGEGVGRKHVKGAIIMAFGGHVEFIKFEKFDAEQIAMPGLLWCTPGSAQGN